MMERVMRKTVQATITTAVLVSLGLAVAAVGAAQDKPLPMPPSVAEQEVNDLKELAEQGARLKTDTEQALKSLDEKQSGLESILKDVRSAREFVDDMIRLLRDTAARLGPDSPYMKTLQAQEELVRLLSREAWASQNTGDHPYGEQLDKQAGTIAALRSEARDIAARLAAEIDRLDRSKSQLGFAYAVKRTDAFIKTARGYLDAARRVLQGTADLATKAEQIAAPTVPTQ
jgi:hypothetical protein